jgi:hypothetical protein
MAKLASLVDNFPGSTIDDTKWSVLNGAPTSLSDNQAELPCLATYPELRSVDGWDLRSSQITAGFTPPTLTVGAGMALTLEQNSTNYVAWVLQTLVGNSVILCPRLSIAGVITDLRLVYDTSVHTYWRIREQNGYLYWDTSPNGKFWVNQRYQASGALDVSTVSVRILCGVT